jgi:ribosome recycling factor
VKKSEAKRPILHEPVVDINQLVADFDHSIKTFTDKAKDIRAGNANVSKFEAIQVTKHGNPHTIKQLANVQLRGSRMTIVAFDPHDVKYIQTAVIQSLNVPPQVDPKNNQTLIVDLSVNANEHKQSALKALKDLHSHFRSSPSKHSLNSIRGAAASILKKKKIAKEISENDFEDETKQVEKLYKDYVNKLAEAFKAAEK